MNDQNDQPISGLVNLYKPTGWSSAQYVYRLRPILGLRKIGHGGTLDPFADGVLIACVGRGTKLVEQLYALPKHYRTTMTLGVTNACYDMELPLEPVPGSHPLPRDAVAEAVAKFTGTIDQIPPSFSAVKINGVASYRLAKRGATTTRLPKQVRINSIEIRSYEWPNLTLDIHCGRGTYIRAIARDLGNNLACGAVCQTLTRISVGPFNIDNATNLTTTDPANVASALIPIPQAKAMIDEVTGTDSKLM